MRKRSLPGSCRCVVIAGELVRKHTGKWESTYITNWERGLGATEWDGVTRRGKRRELGRRQKRTSTSTV